MTSTVERAAGHRSRLLQGMTGAVAAKGYQAVTIADVVSAAGVSKRTFYEHFSGKLDCLLACYQLGWTGLRDQLAERARDTGRSRAERVRSVLDAYLAYMDLAPELSRTLLIEVPASGAEGRAMRREAVLTIARLLQEVVVEDGADFGLDQAIALVGGVTELVLVHVDAGTGRPFRDLTPSVLTFVTAVLPPPA